jgi:hypothetical protein
VSDETETTVEGITAMDSDSILVGAYVMKVETDELRRYVALDLITALNPWSKDTIKQARDVEQFLQGKGLKAVE